MAVAGGRVAWAAARVTGGASCSRTPRLPRRPGPGPACTSAGAGGPSADRARPVEARAGDPLRQRRPAIDAQQRIAVDACSRSGRPTRSSPAPCARWWPRPGSRRASRSRCRAGDALADQVQRLDRHAQDRRASSSRAGSRSSPGRRPGRGWPGRRCGRWRRGPPSRASSSSTSRPRSASSSAADRPASPPPTTATSQRVHRPAAARCLLPGTRRGGVVGVRVSSRSVLEEGMQVGSVLRVRFALCGSGVRADGAAQRVDDLVDLARAR
jgi:hypothetical protein